MRLVTLKSIVQQLLRLFELTVATSCHFTYFIPLGLPVFDQGTHEKSCTSFEVRKIAEDGVVTAHLSRITHHAASHVHNIAPSQFFAPTRAMGVSG